MNAQLSQRFLFLALAGFTVGGVVRADAPASGSSSINLHAVIAGDGSKPEKPPAFHSAVVGESVVVTPGAALVTARIEARVVQGEPEVVSFELAGDGDIAAVTGKSIRDWSVRRDASGRRFLDIRPAPGLKKSGALVAEVAAKFDRKNPRGAVSPLLLLPAGAVSSEVSLRVTSAEGVALRVTEAAGLVPLASGDTRVLSYLARGPAKLTLAAGFSSESADPVTLDGFRLAGRLAGDRASFELNAVARVREAGASCVVLAGGAALREIPADAGYRVRLDADATGRPVCRLEFDKAGEFSVKLAFDARVTVRGDSRSVDFAVPAAQVAPYALTGLDAGTTFETAGAAPLAEGGAFAGHLPPGGELALAWRERTQAEADARLFFSTEETTEVAVGAGSVDRSSHYEYKILQGKMDTLAFDLTGRGEVLRVTGDDILEWKLTDRNDAPGPSGESPEAARRRLIVKLARPHAGRYALTVETRNTPGVFPATFAVPGLSPEGAVHHGGLLRITNAGAVRLEITPERALTQVPPSAFPAPARAGASQAFVYRVSSSDAAYTVHADNILPEIAVSQIAVCTLDDRDYTLDADLDVEVREAPLRELRLTVPEGYSVASASAPGLADRTLVSGKPGEPGELRLDFANPVSGRLLVKLRLEKNRTDDPAVWKLPALGFPGAKSVRGFVGVRSAPGFRLTSGAFAGLSETAPAFFPVRIEGLQQAWRVREPEWTAAMKVEKLGVAVQADVFRQYAVREGSVSESTLVNYVIVGAPVQTLRFRAPKEAANLEFAGDGIQGWKTENGVTEVSLQRGVTGAFTLMATCELPFGSGGGEPDFSGIRPLDAPSQQGLVLVTSDRPFGVSPGEMTPNLAAIEPGEIPPEYRMIADAPLLAAYRYSGDDYTLHLKLSPRGVAETIPQVVDLASLSTKVSRAGGCVTTCRYLVKSYGRPHLRLLVPATLRLWTAKVDGREVVPVTEGAETLVPLPATAGPDSVTTVELRVAQGEAPGTVFVPLAPAPLSPVVNTVWKFTPDAGRSLVRTGGAMAQISGAFSRDALTELDARLRTFRGALAALSVAALVGFGIGAMRRGRHGSRFWRIFGTVSLTAAAGVLAVGACLAGNHAAAGETVFSASVLEAGHAPLLRLANLPETGFAPGAFGIGALALGGVLLAGGVIRRKPALRAAGWGALVVAPLFVPGGLPLSFGAGALLLLGCGVAPAFLSRRNGFTNTTAALALFTFLPFLPSRAEAATPAPVSVDATVAADIRAVFTGRRWAWFENRGANGPYGTMEFLDGGRCRFTGEIAGWLSGWEPAGPGKIKVKHRGSGYWIFEYKPAMDEAESISGEGSIDAGKILRPLAEPAGNVAAESVRQSVKLSDGRVESSGEMRISGRAGDRFDLIAAPAVLTGCKPPDGVRLSHRAAGGKTIVQLVAERDGVFTTPFSYVMPLESGRSGFVLPTGRAAADTLTVASANADLVFSGAGVVSVSPDAGNSGSSAALVYSPVTRRSLDWAPKTRDARNEKLVFYAEVANLFIPSPGVLEGRHTVRIRPARGVVRELTVAIPKGLTVSGVTGEAVGAWRYDPETGALHVSADAARATPFEFHIGTQAALGAFPAVVKLAAPVVRDAAGSVGLIGLASGDEVRFDTIAPEGLSPVNTDDFPVAASPGAEKIVVRRAFRAGAGPASVTVRLAAVEPEVRVTSRQTVSAGDDRVTVNAIVSTEILRAGLFKLSFVAPDGFDVDSVGGPALANWAEIKDRGRRVIVMNLRGRTLGEQRFVVALSGPGLSGKSRWTPPRIALNEASRVDGELLIVPEEGLRLHPSVREGVTQTDPGSGAKRGALAFRLLKNEYKLDFAVENAAPWIRCDWLQDMTLLEGRVNGVVRFDYTVENAAVRALRVRLPEDAEGVRFAGELVADAAPVAGKPGEWEVKLQRRVIGKVVFDATFRTPAIAPGKPGSLRSAGPADAGVRRGWLALRTGGRLSVETGVLPEALQPADRSSVPPTLRRGLDEAARTLRVSGPEFTLPLAVTTHDPAKLLPVRVKSVAIDSMLSTDGRSLTSCRLELSLAGKSSLRLALPPGAALWQVFANNRAVSAAIDGKSLVIPVEPNPGEGAPATVELVYDSGTAGKLVAPAFGLPLENIVWRVNPPAGTRVAARSGALVLRESPASPEVYPKSGYASYDGEGYARANAAALSTARKDADALIRLGGKYRAEGDQERAKNAFSLAQSLSVSDAALNEDARVQYGNLRASQIEFGLNRRRAQVLQDNGGLGTFASRNGTSEVLANKSVNFTAEDADRLRTLTGDDSGTALRRLAERLARLQQATAFTPEGIRTPLPQKAGALVFTGSLYDAPAGAPLEIDVRLTDTGRAGPVLRVAVLLAAMLVAVGIARLSRRKA